MKLLLLSSSKYSEGGCANILGKTLIPQSLNAKTAVTLNRTVNYVSFEFFGRSQVTKTKGLVTDTTPTGNNLED